MFLMPELSDLVGTRRLILVSNREPYEHVRTGGILEVRRPPGGLVSALDPLMRRTNGTWVAWGSGNADRDAADRRGHVPVPPEDPSYTLRRVWLSEAEVEGYYQGFANSALWPLCHMFAQHFEPRSDDWEQYRLVNERFAHAVAEEAAGATDPVIWIQDYHLALVAGTVRTLVPGALIHQFWHIPFPPPDIFQLMPSGVGVALLRGMLGNDLLEFQTERAAKNFLACVSELIPDARIDPDGQRVQNNGRTTTVRAFPISIDYGYYESLAREQSAVALANRLRDRYATKGRQLAVCVDRVDYTKGIPERLRALDLMWERHSELRECLTFLIVATPSRSALPVYQQLEEQVATDVKRINARYRTKGWTPIVLIQENVSADRLAAIYRAADLCLVSSLQDGMNLVAKEFIACQVDERGLLLLSRFAGAAEEIEGATLINPFNIDGFADGLNNALAVPRDERRTRMARMRADLRGATIFDWLRSILTAANQLRPTPRIVRSAKV
jgi:alpha,alpha-trehalose-phosphate synthase [UDP-forming]